MNGRMATLVMTRSSDSSYLKRVELQNGCLSRRDSNLFIPSTLAGSCIHNGQVDHETLCKNLDVTIDTYITYVEMALAFPSSVTLPFSDGGGPHSRYSGALLL